MKTIRLTLALLVATSFPGFAYAKIKTQTVEYREGDAILEGVLTYDDSSQAKRPGVLVVHEWNGIGTHVLERSKELAKLGYIAFAADIYGKGVRPSSMEESAKTAGIYKSNRPLLQARVNAALKQLKSFPQVNRSKTAAIGYCFGGTSVLELARSGAETLGVVSFHGALENPTPDNTAKIKSKVLVLHGADDPYVPGKEVEKFREEMKNAKVDMQFTAYSGAVHSFTNKEAGNDNSKGAAYNESADKRSWIAMKDFFKEIF